MIGCLSGNVPLMWPMVAPLLAKAMPYSDGLTLETVHADLLAARAQLWCAFLGNRLIGCEVTEIVRDPSGRVECWLAVTVGDGLRLWGPAMLAVIKPWAQALGCHELRARSPRHGFARHAPALGFREVSIIYAAEL